MKRTQLLKRVLSDCYCRLQPSTIHGIGVFAIRNIPSRTNPFGTIRKYAQPGYVRITDTELALLPPKVAALIQALFVPTDGKLYVPTCGMNVVYLRAFLNHSATPNLRTKDGYNFYAKRSIREGEELTVDYDTYDAQVPGVLTPSSHLPRSPDITAI